MSFDQNVTNNVIMGTGITNGGFTVDRVATGNPVDGQSIEIGLRARERHDLVTNLPSNVTGSQGNGKYNQNADEPPGFVGAGQNRARWNFDWSINTRASGALGAWAAERNLLRRAASSPTLHRLFVAYHPVGASNPATNWALAPPGSRRFLLPPTLLAGGAKVDDYTYRLGMDFDAGFGTNYQTFDLINLPCADHSFGDFSTAQSAGVEVPGNPGAPIGGSKCGAANSVADSAAYALLIANNELAQNSWNFDFFDTAFAFDPTANGQYSIFLEAIGATGAVLARSSIDVIVGTGAVPEPASLALAGLALAGLAAASRRKTR